ncbi:MAG: hypothetical protein HY744_19825, partial [Deltaproteobacteria bacterium]|nr:hypothetical protein [Deltaproteobacteria bacterium]
MTSRFHAARAAGALVFIVPLAAGCAARTAPFDELDQAPATVLRLQAYQPQATPQAQPAPVLIPGLPPEMQQLGQQVLQGLQQWVPPGVLPPGMIPGQPQATPAQAPPRLYKNTFVIVAEQPLMDEKLKGELLDIFGSESSFVMSQTNCFTPGMAVIFSPGPTPTQPARPPLELMISLSCTQVRGDGFQWPYPFNGF